MYLNKLIQTRYQDIVVVVFITLVIFMLFLPLFFPKIQFVVTPDFGRNDSFHMSIATKYFLWEKLQANEIPLWSKKLGSGFPVHAEGQIGTFFLPNLVFYKLLKFETAYNMSLFFSVWLFAIGIYVWFLIARFSRMTALYVSLTACISGIIFTHLTHITLLQSLSLLPWIMTFSILILHAFSLRNALVLGTLLSQQLLAGFVQASFISILLLVSYVFFHLWRMRKILFDRLLLFFLTIILFVGQSAVFLLPAQEFLGEISNPEGFTFSTATQFDFPLKHLLTFWDPFYFGNPKFGTYPPFHEFDGSIFWENTGYMGFLPIGLLIVACIKVLRKRNSLFVFWTSVMIISFLCMLGNASPIYFIYTYWPFNLFRVPSRFLWTFVLGFMWISATSFELFWKSSQKKVLHKLLLFIFVCINTAVVAGVWKSYHALMPAESWLVSPVSTNHLKSESRVMNIGTEVVHNEVFLRDGWQDMQSFIFWRNFIYPNSNLFWNISHVQESMGRVLRRTSVIRGYENNSIVFDEKSVTTTPLFDHLLTINGVSDVLTPYFINSPILKETDKIVEGSKSVNVYTNIDLPSRTFLARKIQKIQTLRDFEQRLIDTTIDFKTIAFVENDLPILPASLDAHSEIVAETDTQIQVETKKNENSSLLVLRDTWYPGWEAFVDGIKTPIYPVNIHHRAVIVPKGDHLVTFQYRPKSFFRGIKISSLFWLVTIILFFVGTRLEKKIKHLFLLKMKQPFQNEKISFLISKSPLSL